MIYKNIKPQKTIWVHPKQLPAAHSEQLVHGSSAGHADSSTSSLYLAPLAELLCWAREPCGHCARLLPASPQGHAVAVPSSTAHPSTALPAVQCGFAAAFARRVICSGTGVGFGTRHRDHTYYLNTAAKGLEGKKKKKGKKENEYEIFVAVWRYTHTCTHNTNTPAWLRIAGSRGRKTLAKIVFKTTLVAESAEGKPFGPNLVPATCQAGVCTALGWGSRGSPSDAAGARKPCQSFPGGCPPARLQKAGKRVQEMEIPREALLVGLGGFFPHNIMESCPRNAWRGGSTCSESGSGDKQHYHLMLAWDK